MTRMMVRWYAHICMPSGYAFDPQVNIDCP